VTAGIADYLKDFEMRPPATPARIGKMQKRLRFPLPADYRAFLLSADGAAGRMGVSRLELLSSEDALYRTKLYQEQGSLPPDVLLIGTDGAREAYLIDAHQPPLRYINLPLALLDFGELRHCGKNFAGFLEWLAKQRDAGPP
jgi:hypothetical protein